MTEKELDYLADKIADKIINKLFESGDLEITQFPPATDEEIMVGELARLMTLMSTYEDKEEYEQAAIIKNKVDKINDKLDQIEDEKRNNGNI